VMKRLSDLESQTDIKCTEGNTVWRLNGAMWVAIIVAANLLHPPAIVMLGLNAAFLLLTMSSVQNAGYHNTPAPVLILVALQALVSLQYASIVLGQIF